MAMMCWWNRRDNWSGRLESPASPGQGRSCRPRRRFRKRLEFGCRLLLAGWSAVALGIPAQASPLVRITEVMSKTHDTDPEPDWFELTNYGSTAYTITGHKVDDAFEAVNAATLQGVTTIGPGESVVFVESADLLYPDTFRSNWGIDGSIQVGTYTGSGLSFSSGGDGATIFTASDQELPGPSDGLIRVSFPAAPGGQSFYWGYSPSGRFGTNRAGTLTPTSGIDGLKDFEFPLLVGTGTAFATPGSATLTAEPPIITWGGSTGGLSSWTWNTTFGSSSTPWTDGNVAEWGGSAFAAVATLGRDISVKEIDAGRSVTVNAGSGPFRLTLEDGAVSVSTGKTLILNPTLSGSVGLTKISAGTMRLGPADYAGPTTVSGGELQLNSSTGQLPTGTEAAVALNARLNLNGRSVTLGGLEGLGDVALGSASGSTLTVSIGDAVDREFNGGLSGSGSLVIDSSGSGEQGLSTRQATSGKTKSYTGGTTVEQGTLRIAADGIPDSTSGVTVKPAGVLRLSSAFDPVAGTGQYLIGAAGAAGNATPVTLEGGVLRQSEGEIMRLNNDLVVASGVTSTIDVVAESTPGQTVNNAAIILTGALRGSGTLSVTGDGRLTLGNFGPNIQGDIVYTPPISGNASDFGGSITLDGPVALAVHHAVAAPVQMADPGSSVGGTGRVGAITGSGGVSPGNSPGVLEAESFDFSGGADAFFEFTGLGSPTWSSPGGSVNDVLRLTGTAPFAGSTSTAGNEINLLFDVNSLAPGQYLGGFFVDGVTDFAGLLEDATVNVYVKGDGLGSALEWNGVSYYTLAEFDPSFSASLGTVAVATADFGGGAVSGFSTSVAVVPEPSGLAGAGLVLAAVFAAACRRRRERFREKPAGARPDLS